MFIHSVLHKKTCLRQVLWRSPGKRGCALKPPDDFPVDGIRAGRSTGFNGLGRTRAHPEITAKQKTQNLYMELMEVWNVCPASSEIEDSATD